VLAARVTTLDQRYSGGLEARQQGRLLRVGFLA
jgi:hypothetical protein